METDISYSDPEYQQLIAYIKAYQRVVRQFGYDTVIQPGRISLLGWDLEYRSGAELATFIDQILIRRLNDFIPTNDHPVILDCGANIGFSVLNYKRQFPKARITAFEPDPEFVPVLRRNLERNNSSDVEIVDAAVWIENGTSQWHCQGVDGSHLSADLADRQTTTSVRTIDFGDYLNEPIDLIKMDIEGAEYEVINHLGGELDNVKAMSIECHINSRMIVPFSEMLRVLRAAGFQLSINSFGSWRDLIRQPSLPSPAHFLNYLTVSAWRGEIPMASTVSSWIPNAGIALYLRDFAQNDEHLYLSVYAQTGRKGLRKAVLRRPFRNEGALCWSTALKKYDHLADDEDNPNRSTMLLFEDTKLLQPAHAMHEDICKLGNGRFSHWKNELYFSTSDKTDPNKNGRTYTIVWINPL